MVLKVTTRGGQSEGARSSELPADRRLGGALGAAVLALSAIVGLDLWDSHAAARDAATRMLSRDAATAGSYLLDRLLALDARLDQARLHVEADPTAAGDALSRRLRALTAPDPSIRALYVLDRSGSLLATSANTEDGAMPDKEDRTADVPPEAAVFAVPSAGTGRPAGLGLARPVDLAAGDGAIVGLLDAEGIGRRLDAAARDPATRIAAYTAGSRLLAGAAGPAAGGVLAACGKPGGPASASDWIAACAEVPGYGLTVVAAMPGEASLRSWWVEARYKLGGLLGLAALGIAITAMRRRVAQAHRHTTILSTAIEQSSNAVLITDSRGVIQWANAALARQSGYAIEELLGSTPRILKSGLQPQAYYDAMWRTVLAGRVWRGEILNRTKDGELYRVRQVITPLMDSRGGASHFVAIEEDVTEILRHQAFVEGMKSTDLFTGLPNRAGFQEGLAALRLAPEADLVGVLDLTGLSAVNDSAGRDVGDQALLHVGDALQRDGRAMLAARLGDDEFGFVLSGGGSADATLATLADLRADIEDGVRRIEGCGMLAVRVGFAMAEGDGTDSVALLERAEVALNAGRGGARPPLVGYTRDLADRAARQQKLKSALRGAVEAGEISFLVQPKVGLPAGGIVGAELLMRWRHRDLGPVPPSEFIPLAEQTGDIVGLGRAALDAALRLAARVPADQSFRIAVNASAIELSREGFAGSVIDALRHAGVAPERLVIELTETAAATAGNTLRAELRQLLDAGFGIDIDDFGTGYATLSQLRDLPFTGIKIDRSFVAPLPEDRHAHLIVQGVIALATSLGAGVVAEGIETAGQARALAELGCRHGQGYLYGQPVEADALLAQMLPAAAG